MTEDALNWRREDEITTWCKGDPELPLLVKKANLVGNCHKEW